MRFFKFFFALLIIPIGINAQVDLYQPRDLDTVKWSLNDFGAMWTFDDVPVTRFEKLYSFTPTDEWLGKVQRAALQFGGGCSAAFVSGDGLIMTNHHCGRNQLASIQDEGENWLRDGFYAEDMDDERPVPNLYVDQLISITDVTDEVKTFMNKGETDDEKIALRDSIKSELIEKYEEETGLTCKIITLYNGGKYSLYAYKRYNDIRLVMAPDFQIAATGWDWDNFTYPRYELDFMFYRAYDEDGNPIKSKDHFTWSKKGAKEGEPIFVVGRPGHTDRLLSVANLEYLRDVIYTQRLKYYEEIYQVYFEIFKAHPERESELLNKVMGYGNGRKSYAGRLYGLRNQYLMKKKYDFEKDLIKKVKSDSLLNQKYGHIWESIQNVIDELRSTANEYYGYMPPRYSASKYFEIARNIITYAKEIKKPEDERNELYKEDVVEDTREIIFPDEFDKELNDKLLRAHANVATSNLGKDNKYLKKLYDGKTGEEAVEYALSKSLITSKDDVAELLKKSPDEILNCDDPFISFLINTHDIFTKLDSQRTEAKNTLDVLNQELGEVIFKVYGSAIPPDATSSLRIADGVIKGYEYNGTIAPGKTTFFGLWDRYYSFGEKTYPWGLHERWQKIPEELDLKIPIGFASTNDIVGGNSGSSVINKNLEVVGLVHDGNLESLAGHFIYDPENNRAVASDSWGLMEALKYIYKTDRLVDELLSGKLD
ncbi:MAG: S46 family peptidase [Chlorobi bacterium]|nr:S46 family peptidase [Chlorobiota bacterium]